MSNPTSTFNAMGFSRYSRGAETSFVRRCLGGNMEPSCVQNYLDGSGGGGGGTVEPGSVTTEDLADGAVTEPKIADGAVTADKIEDATITSNKLAPGVIPSGNGGRPTLTGTIDFSSDHSLCSAGEGTNGPIVMAGYTPIEDSELDVATGEFFHFNTFPKAPVAIFGDYPLTVRPGVTFLNPGNGDTSDRDFDYIFLSCRAFYIPDSQPSVRFLLGANTSSPSSSNLYDLGFNLSSGAFDGATTQTVSYLTSGSTTFVSSFFMVPAPGKLCLAYKLYGNRAGWEGNAFSAGFLKPEMPYDKLTALSPAPSPFSFSAPISIPLTVTRTDSTTMTFQVTDWSSVPTSVESISVYLTVPEAKMYAQVSTPSCPSALTIFYDTTSTTTRTVDASVAYEAFYVANLKKTDFGSPTLVFYTEVEVTVQGQ